MPVKVFIKNMTTLRSQQQVKLLIENMGLRIAAIDIGEIEIKETLSEQNFSELKKTLIQSSFELVSGKENILTEKVKSVIIEMIHYSDELPVVKYSSYISNKLKANYTYLSKIFSKVKNVTIEQFIILNKIERVKQLLLHNDLTLSEIAWKLHYSSTTHLSAQFKKITGITPTLFKKIKNKKLMPLENL
jgi:AraC-like DNA-binding protein